MPSAIADRRGTHQLPGCSDRCMINNPRSCGACITSPPRQPPVPRWRPGRGLQPPPQALCLPDDVPGGQRKGPGGLTMNPLLPSPGMPSARPSPGRSSSGLTARAGAAPGQDLRSGALTGKGEPGPKQDQLRSECPRFEGNPVITLRNRVVDPAAKCISRVCIPSTATRRKAAASAARNYCG